MLKFKNKDGKTVGVLQDDASEPTWIEKLVAKTAKALASTKPDEEIKESTDVDEEVKEEPDAE